MRKVLIIKTGYSETLESAVNNVVCLGDVLRTTIVLHFFKNDRVEWLTSREAAPLLAGNKYIAKLFIDKPGTRQVLKKCGYDVVINFEKGKDECRLAMEIAGAKKYGFCLKRGHVAAWQGMESILRVCRHRHIKRNDRHVFQEHIIRAIGKEWSGQEYLLSYKPRTKVKYDIGFNWSVGSRWKNKAWPMPKWRQLASNLRGKYAVSWQKGLKSIHRYADWINSCRLLVTNDTLGLHIALALGKQVVCICGPTSSSELHLYGLGRFVKPRKRFKCMPCLETVCRNKKFCLEDITAESVLSAVKAELQATGI